METPKLGVASILWLNFYLTKTRVLAVGPTQSLIATFDVKQMFSLKMDATPSFGVFMDIQNDF